MCNIGGSCTRERGAVVPLWDIYRQKEVASERRGESDPGGRFGGETLLVVNETEFRADVDLASKRRPYSATHRHVTAPQGSIELPEGRAVSAKVFQSREVVVVLCIDLLFLFLIGEKLAPKCST